MQISYCPVCGFPFDKTIKLEELRNSFDICDCCGCEYGCDDTSTYRDTWLKKGAPWFMKEKCPREWHLKEQIKNIIVDWDELRFDIKKVFPEIFNN